MRTMPAIASTTAPTTSPSSATWPSISSARSHQRAPCASRSSVPDGRTHPAQKPPLKFKMRWPASPPPAEDLSRRVPAFETRLNQDPYAVADRLWVKDHLDPD